MKAECTSEGESATASDGFELGKVQRLKRDTPHPLHPFESTPPSFTLPPSSRPFLASPRLLSPPVGQLHPPPHHDSLFSSSLPPLTQNEPSISARAPPPARVGLHTLSLAHQHACIYPLLPYSYPHPPLCHLPSTSATTQPCGPVLIRRRYSDDTDVNDRSLRYTVLTIPRVLPSLSRSASRRNGV